MTGLDEIQKLHDRIHALEISLTDALLLIPCSCNPFQKLPYRKDKCEKCKFKIRTRKTFNLKEPVDDF